MREIKFRAWDKETKKFILNYEQTLPCHYEGNLERHHMGVYVQNKNNDDCELLLCTGLKDKNGKEIYEGDIIKYCYIIMDKRKKIKYEYLTVKWDDIYTGFTPFSEIWGYGLARFDDFYEWEVIGNIYENPDLI